MQTVSKYATTETMECDAKKNVHIKALYKNIPLYFLNALKSVALMYHFVMHFMFFYYTPDQN